MDNFVPPSVEFSVKLLTTYSVGAAVAVNVLGFVIAAYHYSKLGVGPGSLPLLTVWGAGLSFSALTVFFLHVGYTSWNLAHSTRPSEAFSYSGAGLLLLVLLSVFFLRHPGVITYCVLCLFAGVGAAAGILRTVYIPTITENSIRFVWPAIGFVSLLAAVWAYTVLAYPNLARSLGGAAPHPVRLILKSSHDRALPRGSRIYEVLATGDTLFIEVVLPPGAAPKKPRSDMFWFRRLDPAAAYLAIPRSAVEYVEYTDTFNLAPLVGDVVEPAEDVAPQMSPPDAGLTPSRSPTTPEAPKTGPGQGGRGPPLPLP